MQARRAARPTAARSGTIPPTMLQRLANPYLLLTLAALFWSSNMVIGRAIRELEGDIHA